MQPLQIKKVYATEVNGLEQPNFNIHQDIIDECIRGSRLAYYQLYKLYSKAMFNVCLRIVNNADDAEDVLQEAFVSAFKNLRAYKGDAAFGAWLKRIVINKSLNLIKKKSIVTEPLQTIPDRSADVDDHSIDTDQWSVNKVKEAIKKLPDGYRLVFSLYVMEGYDHQEIGEILGISASTSKSQLNRSKKKLRQLLEAHG